MQNSLFVNILLNTTEDSSTLKNMWKHFLSVNNWHSKKSDSEGASILGTQLYLIVKPKNIFLLINSANYRAEFLYENQINFNPSLW